MRHPKRTVATEHVVAGEKQRCTWDFQDVSEGWLITTLSDEAEFVRIKIMEKRVDGSSTQRASVTLDRSKSIELIKILSALI